MEEEKNRSFLKSNTYEEFRNYLKVNFYYCSLAREQQAEYTKALGKTRYNEYMNMVKIISEGKIAFPKYNKKIAFKYDISQFESDYNVFANSFMLKNITSFETCTFLFILCLLTEKPMSSKEIIARAEIVKEDIDEKTVLKKIRAMCDYGLISYDGQNYYLGDNMFYSIDESLLLKLVNMADFMKNLVSPEVSGYNLFNIIKEVYIKRTGKDYYSPFQFKYSHIANILDDNVLWTLIEAIEARQYVSFKYDRKQKEKIIPVMIFTDNEYDRRYLYAAKKIRNNYKTVIFRLAKIYDLSIMDKEEAFDETEYEKLLEKYRAEKEFSFLGKLDSSEAAETVKLKYKPKRGIKKQLKRDFRCIRFENNHTAEVTVKNKKMIKPYLRANMETISAIDDEFSEDMKAEIEEMKKIYGIIS